MQSRVRLHDAAELSFASQRVRERRSDSCVEARRDSFVRVSLLPQVVKHFARYRELRGNSGAEVSVVSRRIAASTWQVLGMHE